MTDKIVALETIVPERSVQLVRSVSEELASITSVVIETDEQATAADAMAKRLIEHEKKLKEDQKLAEAPYADPLKIVKDGYKSVFDAIDNAKRKIKQARWTYDDLMAKKRHEKQQHLIHEKLKIRKEQQRKADEARRKAEEAAVGGNEAKAEKLLQKADELEAIAATMVDPIVPNTTPELTRATARREIWKGEITDEEQFKGWCVTNCRWEFLSVSATAWNQYAKVVRVAQVVPGASIRKEYC